MSKKSLQGTLCLGGGANQAHGDYLCFLNMKTKSTVDRIKVGTSSNNIYSTLLMGRNTLLVEGDRKVTVIDLRKKCVKKRNNEDYTFNVHQSYGFYMDRCGRDLFCTGGSPGAVKVWKMKKPGTPVHEFTSTSQVYCVKNLRVLKSRIASCGTNNLVEIWNLRERKKEFTITPGLGNLWHVGEVPSLKSVCYGGYTTPVIHLRDVRRMDKISKTSVRVNGAVWNTLPIPNKNQLWVGTNQGQISVLDYRKMDKIVHSFRAHNSVLYKTEFLPKRRCVLSSGMDRFAKIHRVKDYKLVSEYNFPSYVYCAKIIERIHHPLYLHHGGEGGMDEINKILNKKDEKRKKTLVDRFENVMGMTKSADDSQVLSLKFLMNNQRLSSNNKGIRILRSFLVHSPVLNADPTLSNQLTKDSVNICPVSERLVYKFLLAKKPMTLLSSLWTTNFENLEETSLFSPFDDVEDDGEGGGGKVTMNGLLNEFSLAEQREFVDVYALFKYLNLPYEMALVLHSISKIQKPEILFLLFIKCLYYFERRRVQALFLPPEDILTQPSQTFPPSELGWAKEKKEEEEETEGEEDEEEEDEESKMKKNWDLDWMVSLEKKVLENQVKKHNKQERERRKRMKIEQKIDQKRAVLLEELKVKRKQEIELEKLKRKQEEIEREEKKKRKKNSGVFGFFFGFNKEEEEEEEEFEDDLFSAKEESGELDINDLLEEIGEVDLNEEEMEELERKEDGDEEDHSDLDEDEEKKDGPDQDEAGKDGLGKVATPTPSRFGFFGGETTGSNLIDGAENDIFGDGDGVGFGTIGFESSISMYIFNELKARVADIREDSNIIKFFVTSLESLESYEEEDIGQHIDFLPLKNFLIIQNRKMGRNTENLFIKTDRQTMPTPKEIDVFNEVISEDIQFSRLFEKYKSTYLSSGIRNNNLWTIKIKNNENFEIPVHKEFLIFRSSFFHRQFVMNEEKSNKTLVLNLPDGRIPELEPIDLKILIRYHYCGTSSFPSSPKRDVSFFTSIFKILVLAHHSDEKRTFRDLITFFKDNLKGKTKKRIISIVLRGLEGSGYFNEEEEKEEKAKTTNKKEEGEEEVYELDENEVLLDLIITELSDLELKKEGEFFDVKEFLILIEKAIQKFRVDRIIKELKHENMELREKNKKLELEKSKLLKN